MRHLKTHGSSNSIRYGIKTHLISQSAEPWMETEAVILGSPIHHYLFGLFDVMLLYDWHSDLDQRLQLYNQFALSRFGVVSDAIGAIGSYRSPCTKHIISDNLPILALKTTIFLHLWHTYHDCWAVAAALPMYKQDPGFAVGLFQSWMKPQ